MVIYPFPKTSIRNIAIILFTLYTTSLILAQESKLDLDSKSTYLEEDLSELQKQARLYRNQGLEFQRLGNFDMSLSLYQKAAESDPSYAVIYNDLGVIYEAKGFIDRAEESYLQAIKTEPDFLSPYSNLALLYENKRDLNKAAFYWEKRVTLGSADDPWTEKARLRLKNIGLVLPQKQIKDKRTHDTVSLIKKVVTQKALQKKDNKELAKIKFYKAMLAYEKEDEVTALKEAVDARSLDPSNKEIEKFIEKVQRRLLSR